MDETLQLRLMNKISNISERTYDGIKVYAIEDMDVFVTNLWEIIFDNNQCKPDLKSFIEFMTTQGKDLRFWQGVKTWSNKQYVLTAEDRGPETGEFKGIKDTFYE